MSYTEPVSFSSTNNYGCGPDDEDDVYTVEEFKQRCESRSFVDYDGFGHPVKDGKADEKVYVYPSKVSDIPSEQQVSDSSCGALRVACAGLVLCRWQLTCKGFHSELEQVDFDELLECVEVVLRDPTLR